jgi:hypothetical protein
MMLLMNAMQGLPYAEAQYFHHVPRRDEGPALALSAVARYGDRSDLARLRGVSRGHPFARHAVAALKALDAVAG